MCGTTEKVSERALRDRNHDPNTATPRHWENTQKDIGGDIMVIHSVEIF